MKKFNEILTSIVLAGSMFAGSMCFNGCNNGEPIKPRNLDYTITANNGETFVNFDHATFPHTVKDTFGYVPAKNGEVEVTFRKLVFYSGRDYTRKEAPQFKINKGDPIKISIEFLINRNLGNEYVMINLYNEHNPKITVKNDIPVLSLEKHIERQKSNNFLTMDVEIRKERNRSKGFIDLIIHLRASNETTYSSNPYDLYFASDEDERPFLNKVMEIYATYLSRMEDAAKNQEKYVKMVRQKNLEHMKEVLKQF